MKQYSQSFEKEIQKTITENKSVFQEKKYEISKKETNYEIMNKILEMFGSDKVRENFLDLCKQYYEKLRAQKLSSVKDYSESEKGRADLHNKIMKIIQKLSLTQTKNQKIFFGLNREKITEIIKEYFDIKLRLKQLKLTQLGKMRLGEFE